MSSLIACLASSWARRSSTDWVAGICSPRGLGSFFRALEAQDEPLGLRAAAADHHRLVRRSFVGLQERVAVVGNALEHLGLARPAGTFAARRLGLDAGRLGGLGDRLVGTDLQ